MSGVNLGGQGESKQSRGWEGKIVGDLDGSWHHFFGVAMRVRRLDSSLASRWFDGISTHCEASLMSLLSSKLFDFVSSHPKSKIKLHLSLI